MVGAWAQALDEIMFESKGRSISTPLMRPIVLTSQLHSSSCQSMVALFEIHRSDRLLQLPVIRFGLSLKIEHGLVIVRNGYYRFKCVFKLGNFLV